MVKREIDLGKLYQPQLNCQQMLAHRASERYILYGGAKGGGKTAFGINEGIQLSLEYPGNRGFMGCRDGTDFKRNALGQVFKFLPAELYAPPLGGHNKQEQCFRLINGSVIYYGGVGSEAEARQKISNMPELGWVFIDQAEQISENQFLLLDGQLRLSLPGIRYKVLLTANPDPGWLRKRFIEDDLPDHRFIPAKPGDNPFLPPDYKEKLLEIWPEDMVRALIEGDWDVPGVNYLFPYQQIREAINRELPASGITVGGLDVAEFGESRTVFVARQGNKVLHIESWAHMDTEFSAGMVAELFRKWKLVVLNIDSIGKGGEVFVLLNRDGYKVRKVIVSEASSRDIYVNKRAEYYGMLAKRFEMGEIDIPDNSQLASQLASIKYKYKGTKLQIESKGLARKRGVKSPDFADALMLAFISSEGGQMAHAYLRGRQIW